MEGCWEYQERMRAAEKVGALEREVALKTELRVSPSRTRPVYATLFGLHVMLASNLLRYESQENL